MSVLACDRRDCEHVMCDRLVLGSYLCSSCIAELEEWRKTWPEDMSVHDVAPMIAKFFDTSPGSMLPKVPDPEGVEKEFRRILNDSGL